MKEPDAACKSALRTLDSRGSAFTALAAALQSDLGPAFAAATELIPQRQGPPDHHRLGKSGHIRPQDRGDLCLHRHAGVLRARREAGHGDLGMITPTMSSWRCRGPASSRR